MISTKLSIIVWAFLLLLQSCENFPTKQENGKHLDSPNLKKELKKFLKQFLEEAKEDEVITKTRGNERNKVTFSKDEIDTKHVDKNSDLEDLLEAMSCNGNKAVGIHPALKDTVKAMDSEESHNENSQENVVTSQQSSVTPSQQSSVTPPLNDVTPQHNETNIKRNFVPPIVEDIVQFQRRWQNGDIPYYVDINAFGYEYREKLLHVLTETIAEYREKTCINLHRITPSDVKSGYYKYFINVTNLVGCYSVVGMQTWGGLYELPPGQLLSLDQSHCLQTRTAIHEFGHAIGMSHEQKRTDRDNHIQVLFENIEEQNEKEFTKSETLDRNPYDYNSVMQYALNRGASATWTKAMAFRDPDLEFLAEHSKTLTFYDVMDVSAAYNCTKHCKFEMKCLNGGYMDHTCQCKCPVGTTGRHCENASGDDDCSDVIDLVVGEEVTISSPNYPKNYDTGKTCYWLLRAENPNQRVLIEVEDFELSHNKDLCRCYHWLEVRYNLVAQPGPKYCGTHFERNKISTTEFGNSHMMMLTFDTSTVTGANSSRGFTLKARAVELTGQGCTNAPPKVPNSSNNFNDIRASFGAIVKYTCDYKYQMLGKDSVTCEADGTWSKERFRCVKYNPVFECDFEDGNCGVTLSGLYHGWSTESEDNNKFYTVIPEYSKGRAVTYFTVPVVLKADVTYCLSFFFKRYNEEKACAHLYIGDLNENYFPWIYTECTETEWTHFIGDFGPYDKDMQMQFIPFLANGGHFNIDIDDIILMDGSC